MNQLSQRGAKLSTAILGILSLWMVIGIILSPDSVFQASLQGLSLWWHIVFPSLLPFLVLSEILTAYGLIHAAGVLLEPFMRKVFKLPGVGGWVLVLGMTVGFPGGARSAKQLVDQQVLEPQEGVKLSILAHFCSPVLLLMVIAAGLLQNPQAGYSLILIHWASGLLAYMSYAAISRSRKTSSRFSTYASAAPDKKNHSLLQRVTTAAADAHAKDGRSIGKLLGESVTHAVQHLMVIGGYIIVFAVIIQLLSSLLPGLPHHYIAGLLEVHLGAKAISDANLANTVLQYGLLSALLGWSGISSIFQSRSFLNIKNSMLPSLFVRALHGGYAFLMTILLWNPLHQLFPTGVPAFTTQEDAQEMSLLLPHGLWTNLLGLLQWQGGLLLVLLLGSMLISQLTRKSSR